jgi:hypothetical protein
VSRNESYCEPNILLHSCFGRWSGREWVLEAALSAVQAIALSLGLDHQRGEGAGAIGSSRARLGLQSCLDSTDWTQCANRWSLAVLCMRLADRQGAGLHRLLVGPDMHAQPAAFAVPTTTQHASTVRDEGVIGGPALSTHVRQSSETPFLRESSAMASSL